jgi:hypothetical protein
MQNNPRRDFNCAHQRIRLFFSAKKKAAPIDASTFGHFRPFFTMSNIPLEADPTGRSKA